jgi:hypothetical protein
MRLLCSNSSACSVVAATPVDGRQEPAPALMGNGQRRHTVRVAAVQRKAGAMRKRPKPDPNTKSAPSRLSLQRGEEIVLVSRPARGGTWPKYLYTLGLYGIWRKRHTFVLTDRRILVGQGVVMRTECSIPFGRVDDAVYTCRGWSGYSEVVCHDRFGWRVERIGPLSTVRAKRFTTKSSHAPSDATSRPAGCATCRLCRDAPSLACPDTLERKGTRRWDSFVAWHAPRSLPVLQPR